MDRTQFLKDPRRCGRQYRTILCCHWLTLRSLRSRYPAAGADYPKPENPRRDQAHQGDSGIVSGSTSTRRDKLGRPRRARRSAPRRPREHARAHGFGPGRLCAAARSDPGHCAAGRPRIDARPRRAAPPPACGDRRMAAGGRALAADRARLRGPALGRIRPRSISCEPSPSEGRKRGSSSSRRRGPSSARPGACAPTTA